MTLCDMQKNCLLPRGSAKAGKVAILQGSKSPMYDPKAVPGGAAAEIVLFDQGYRQAPENSVPRDSRAMNAPTDHQQIKSPVFQLVQISMHRPTV